MKKINPNNIDFSSLTEGESAMLKERIFKTIKKGKSGKRRIWIALSVAASILICLGLGLSFYFQKTSSNSPSITDFVNATGEEDKLNSNEVILTLGKGNSLKITEENAAINYSATGQNVTIGSGKTVQQQTDESKKPVYNTLWVPYGKRSKIKLSDGSIVWLNSGSKMIYPAVFNADKREVYIEGEAIFEVTHNEEKPFFVISENQVVEVLGTVFGVTSYPDENDINTVLKSGSVQISYNGSSESENRADKIKISPGTKASYDKKSKSILSEKVNVNDYFSWREGLLVFKNNDLRFILNRISRYYNITITVEDEVATTETFSGYLDLNEDVKKVIESVKESTNVNYEFNENEIQITN